MQINNQNPSKVNAVRAKLKACAATNKNGSIRDDSISDKAAYFVAVWVALSAADRTAAFRAMGVADVWDTLIKVID
jgi:hypothetical protein